MQTECTAHHAAQADVKTILEKGVGTFDSSGNDHALCTNT